MQLRILHVIGSLNIGGSQMMIMNLYRNIDKNKIQFDFIVDHPNELHFAEEIRQLGGKIYFMPTFKGTNINEVKKSWHEFFSKHPEYTIIHSHVRSYASIFLKIAKKYNLYTIIHSHSTSNGKGISAIIKKILQYPLRYQADYFFACSEEAGKWLYGNKIVNNQNFKILNNAIESQKYIKNPTTRKEYRKKFKISESQTVIGHVGRFSKVKNHEKLLNVFSKYNKINNDSILILIGDGEERENIERQIKNLEIEDKVLLLGARDDVPQLLKIIDLFVFPSQWEGFGIALIEAQFANIKILASDTIPKNTCISNGIKYISLEKDDDYWANEIENAIKTKNKYELYETESEKYDISKQVEELEKFYFSIHKKGKYE